MRGCSSCDARYRVPTFEDADPIIKGCERLAKNNPEFWLAVAIRVAAGYLGHTEKDVCDAHEDCRKSAELGAACKTTKKTMRKSRKKAQSPKLAPINAQLDYASFLGLDGDA